MKPAPFAYEKPDSLARVFELRGEYGEGAALLAGGQSLVAMLNMRLSQPDMLIDLTILNRPGIPGGSNP